MGLSELMLVDQEVTAEEKRLDILASGTDGDQDAIAVIIENQYGATDHRHLGQIITYLAQQQHGLAIWIAEDFSQAHLAAVDFLNRTSIEGVGYLLVRVRFTHALEEYQVHFEVLSRPNAFLKSSTRTSVRKSNPDVVEFVAPVWESLKEPLKQGGLKGVRMHKHGSYIRVRLPDATGLRTVGGYLTYRVTAKDAKVLLGIDGLETGEENLAALRAVKKHYEHRVESPLPSPVDQRTRGIGGAVRAYATSTLTGHGFKKGTAEGSAVWAERMFLAWLQLLTSDPIPDIETAAAEQAAIIEQAALTDEPGG